MGSGFWTHRIIWIGLSLPALFLIAMFSGVGGKTLIEIGDAFCIPMALVAAWVYSRDLFRSRLQSLDYIDLLMMGIWGAWTMNALSLSWRLVGRVYDVNLQNSGLLGLFLIMMTYFAALHILVRGTAHRGVQNYRPARPLFLIGGALLGGLALYIGAKAVEGWMS